MRSMKSKLSGVVAVGLIARRAAWHAKLSAKRRFGFPSVWSTAVLAGGLALLLTLLLFVVGPPPEAALPAPIPASDTVSSGPTEDLQSESTATPDIQLVTEFAWLPVSNELADWQSSAPPFTTAFTSLPPDQWRQTTQRTAPAIATTLTPEPYYLRALLVDAPEETPLFALDTSPGPLGPGAAAGAKLVIEKLAPSNVAPYSELEYTILVSNRGDESANRVVVHELPDNVERVVHAEPPAGITPQGGLLWEIDQLPPGEERRFTVRSLPPDADHVSTVAYVDVQTQIGVSTTVVETPTSPVEETPFELVMPAQQPVDPAPFNLEPEPAEPDPIAIEPDHGVPGWASTEDREPTPAPVFPTDVSDSPAELPFQPVIPEDAVPVQVLPSEDPLPRPEPLNPEPPPAPLVAVEAISQPTAVAGEVVSAVYEITNNGTAPAHGVVLTVELTPELRHRHGRSIEHRILRLDPGETVTANLRALAGAEGVANLRAHIAHDGLQRDAVNTEIRIAPRAE